MCDHFSRLWHQSALTRKEADYHHCNQEGGSKGITVVGTPGPRFPRLEAFFKKEPPRHNRRPCKCGQSDDSWKCWVRVWGKTLLRSGCGE